jgi:hypothetical protein
MGLRVISEIVPVFLVDGLHHKPDFDILVFQLFFLDFFHQSQVIWPDLAVNAMANDVAVNHDGYF